MKYRRPLMFIFIALLLLASCVAARALEPPFSMYFDSEHDMMRSLRAYIENFPDGHPHPRILREDRPGYQLETRRVIAPRITDPDFVLEYCVYAESNWDIGVNYCSYSYKNDALDTIGLLIDYNKNAEAKQIALKRKTDRNQYILVIGDALVYITCRPFQENPLDLFRFEETDLMLPVFVQNKGTTTRGEATTSVAITTSKEAATSEKITTSGEVMASQETVTGKNVTPRRDGNFRASILLCAIALPLFITCCVVWIKKRKRNPARVEAPAEE